MELPPEVKRLFGPMLAGLAIDALDLATFGPVGLYYGLIVGGAAGYWLAPDLGFPPRARWQSALLTGIYCTMPFTAFLPIATAAAAISRAVTKEPEPSSPNSDPALRPEDSIEVDYESHWDDPDSR